MVGWHHCLNGHKFEQAPEDNVGQGSLTCCSPWGHKESDTTKWLNNNHHETQGQVSRSRPATFNLNGGHVHLSSPHSKVDCVVSALWCVWMHEANGDKYRHMRGRPWSYFPRGLLGHHLPGPTLSTLSQLAGAAEPSATKEQILSPSSTADGRSALIHVLHRCWGRLHHHCTNHQHLCSNSVGGGLCVCAHIATGSIIFQPGDPISILTMEEGGVRGHQGACG